MKTLMKTRKAEFHDFPFPSFPVRESKKVAAWHQPSTTYRIRIAGPIGDIESFADEIEVLENAKQGDVVHLQICSPGGDMDTCDFLCRRMDACHAQIVAEIGMTCASAATGIALHADDWIIAESSTFMVHSCSYSPGWGKESDVSKTADFVKRLNREWVIRNYTGFLTEKEMQEVLEFGQDIYFFAEDLADRLTKYAEYRATLGAEEESEDNPTETTPITAALEKAVADIGELMRLHTARSREVTDGIDIQTTM